MKKGLKIIFSTIVFFVILFISKTINANSINKITMDIYVDNSGNATVTEVWSCNVNQGTEVYHPYYNLGNSKISDLKVSEGDIKYQTLSSWNTSGTLDSKSYKCGINRISNGVELCWGMSTYGSHTYTVSYRISNFVADLTDSQMIYWTLIPYEFSNPIGDVYIKIHTDSYLPSTTDVWGYGNYGGTCYVYDGYIEMQSDGQLSTSEYMTILAKFPSGTFNVSGNSLNHNFDYYYTMSQEGSTSYRENKLPIFGTMLIQLLNYIVTFVILTFPMLFFSKKNKLEKELKISDETKKAMKKAPYFRDIPCNKDLYIAYYVARKYNLINSNTSLLGAIILKWLKDGVIKVETRETGKIFKKKNSVIILDSNYAITSNSKSSLPVSEINLYRMLFAASEDGVLENKELEKWCSSHYSKILNWFDDVLASVEDELISTGMIISSEEKFFKFFTATVKTPTPRLDQMAMELSGLKRYLLDYTLIAERKSIEVALFEDYLIFAQLLGIAEKVAKEFKDLYPDVIEQSNFYSYDYILFINTCSYNGIHSASNARSRAQSYSSGGGGFSSGGGGGGSFGGGGGGGGFR